MTPTVTLDLDTGRQETAASGPSLTTAEAKRLLIGDEAPFDPLRGLDMLREADAQDDAEAALILANLAAAGAWRAQSWTDALVHLARAAERGSSAAQGQLSLLAGDDAPPGDWSRRARALDLGHWTSAPQRRAICETPRIRVVEAFIQPQVCDWLIARAKSRLQPAKMLGAYGGAATLSGERTNSDFIIDIVTTDVVISLIRARIAALLKTHTACFHPPQILHYAVGQELKPHFDFLDQSVSAEVGATLGRQVATALIYLNEGYVGGETHFLTPDLKHKGRKGDLVVFANVDHTGFQDRRTRHAGLPVVSGEKWLFSQWVRDQPIAAAKP